MIKYKIKIKVNYNREDGVKVDRKWKNIVYKCEREPIYADSPSA